jgi:predicted site-specific integrase-resolvase
MKAKEVLKLLKVSRPTLCKYVTSGKLKVTLQPNGFYDYDNDTVYKLIGIENREVVMYGRVSTLKQKDSLQKQIETLKSYAACNGFIINKVYSDVASGLSFDRKEFKHLLIDVINHKVKAIIITHKDRFTRVSFDMWKELFEYFNCNIIVINNDEDDDNGLFSDIISLLHCFSMRMYSKRRKKKLQLVKEVLENDIE